MDVEASRDNHQQHGTAPPLVAEHESGRGISPQEVSSHCSNESVWIVLYGKVYDLTDFLGKHPGGDEVILAAAGKEVTTYWEAIHKREWLEQHLRPEWCLGELVVLPGMDPLVEHQLEKPRVAVPTDDIVLTITEDYKSLRLRMQRRQPINMGNTFKIIDNLIRIQSGEGSKDFLMDRTVSLVEERGDPNCTDQDAGGGSTPLLLAATAGSDEHVQRLIDANADPSYKTERGVTALHKFAARPLPDARASCVLNVLLEAQCNINAAMAQGRTPLHVAAQWGQADMCRMLVDRGALTRTRAGSDGTAADWARAVVTDKRKLHAVLSVLEAR